VTGLTGVALNEALGATLTTVGMSLLAVALVVRCVYARWHRTDAIYVLTDDLPRLRWFTRSDVHEVPWHHPTATALVPGSQITVYYHARHPDRWSLTAPHRSAWILFGVGIALNGAGSLLPLVLH
jgi:hypothetical protein